VEHLGLGEAVLPGRRVEHHQRFVRRAGGLPLDHALELGQLIHEVALGVQSAGGVDDQHVGAARHGGLERIEDHRGGIGAGRLSHHLDVDASPPRFQLLDGGGPERVGGGEDDVATLALETGGQLGARGGLAGAVDAEHQQHARARVQRQGLRLAQRVDEEAAQQRTELMGARHRAVHHVLAATVHEVGGDGGAEVGAHQEIFELLPELIGDRTVGFENAAEPR
jgi:hypothetical protein